MALFTNALTFLKGSSTGFQPIPFYVEIAPERSCSWELRLRARDRHKTMFV